MLGKNKNSFYFYPIVITIGFILILLTDPFLKYPYDVIAHLIAIDELYHGANTTTTSIQHPRLLWHHFWADLFHIFNIKSIDFFLRAKIIHTIQVSLTLISIFYFSHVLLRNTFMKINLSSLRYLSLWSTFIWVTMFATFSVYYHLVWTLWYSVNYQITLPLFFYITALTLVVVLENTSIKKKIFLILQILLISRFIIQVHAMEFMYYLMYVSIFSLVYIDKLYHLFKKYYYLFILGAGLLFYLIKNYQSESSKIFNYMSIDTLPLLYDKILSTGATIIMHLNRSDSGSMNELIYFTLYLSSFVFLHLWWFRSKKELHINQRMILFIYLTSAFILIPLTQFTSGLFGVIARPDVIHRIYYSSSLFILLPIFVYYFSQYYHLSLKYIHIMLFSILIGVYIFSSSSFSKVHHYAKNIHSLTNSFDQTTYHFHLTQEQIDQIGQKLHKYEKSNHSKKKIYYYARADIAFVIKYIYHKDVLWKGRRSNPNYIKLYQEKKNNTYSNILFEIPQGFPRYTPYW